MTVIKSFFVFACFPKARRTFRRLKNRLEGVDNPQKSGYRPPLVEYETVDGCKGEIEARYIDLPFLCSPHEEEAREFLSLIVRAEDLQDESARLQIRAQYREYYEAHRFLFEQPLHKDEYVVPSITPEEADKDHCVISHKGSILFDQYNNRGMPIPDFSVLTYRVYKDLGPPERYKKSLLAIQNLERLTGKEFGKTLRVAARFAMPAYYPGLMDTYLDIGVTKKSLQHLISEHGESKARRIYLNTLTNLGTALRMEALEFVLERITPDVSDSEVNVLITRLSDFVSTRDARLLDDHYYQLNFILNKGYETFEENQDIILTFNRGVETYPAVILQEMVTTYGNKSSYAGVLISRDSLTGEGEEAQVVFGLPGDRIMSGSARPRVFHCTHPKQMKRVLPGTFHFRPLLASLERDFKGPVTTEFVVETSRHFTLFAAVQFNEAEICGRATLIAVHDLFKAGVINQARVFELLKPYHLRQILSGGVDESELDRLKRFSYGTAVLPRGAVVAQVYFSSREALAAKQRGETVCLIKEGFKPEDVRVMNEVDAIGSLSPIAIHVVTICQSNGVPALVDLEAHGVKEVFSEQPTATQPSAAQGVILVSPAGEIIKAGDWITISSARKTLFVGKANLGEPRLLKYMKNEPVSLAPGEKETMRRTADAYRWYRELAVKGDILKIDSLDGLIKLVNSGLKGKDERVQQDAARTWFEANKEGYLRGVLESRMGDHLNQTRVFNLLSLTQQVELLRAALIRCTSEELSGIDAGSFMLGRFMAQDHPVKFWKYFTPLDVARLLNEWLLHKKYTDVLSETGDRKVKRARQRIQQHGLPQAYFKNARALKHFITLKLSHVDLAEVKRTIHPEMDVQLTEVLDLLLKPYSEFFDFSQEYSVGPLRDLCTREGISVPGPEDI